MRNHGVDMWIVLDRENNSDPLHIELGGGFSGVDGFFATFSFQSRNFLGRGSQLFTVAAALQSCVQVFRSKETT